ncbi:MAG: SepM family pheromone-processing serine protease [Caldibacillus sp.]
MKKRIKRLSTALIIAIVITLIGNIPLPYYVSRPGMAMELSDVIEVENGSEANGEFMLTTIRLGKANIFSYFMTKFHPYYLLEPEEAVRPENESDEEYRVRQLYMMETSQENALQVAFAKAGNPYEVQYNGIYVLAILEDGPAEGILQPGDRIIAVDDRMMQRADEFTNYVQTHREGETIELTLIRDGEVRKEKVTLQMIPEIGKPGIGISLVEDKEVTTDPQVEIDTEDIGGPSAGLMFALEIYNQLVEEDITKGYRIAGTGTISPEGEVGPIGGIRQKVVAAAEAGAEIFFAPNENGRAGSDYELAVETARNINSDMIIVPVDTFDEALAYLQSLEEK